MKKLHSASSISIMALMLLSASNAQSQEATQTQRNPEQPVHDHPDDHGHEMDLIFVTASPHQKSRLDVLQGSNILSDEELNKQMEATIGETLSGIPGISSTFFGPGASRPIIRGLGGDRIRVLINGIGSIDAASTSPDHAVAGDPLTAERVEILRGASTLLYGNNAVGGVVNIIDSRIPEVAPDMGASGRARLAIDSVTNDRSAGGSINVAASDSIVLHADGHYRRTGDYSIPGFAESSYLRNSPGYDNPEPQSGTVANSDVDNKGGSLGMSLIGENALFGVSFNLNKSNYGVPNGEEEPVRIDLDQKRFDVKGNVENDFLIFEEARMRFGYADYKHVELEDGSPGTSFNNKGWEGRMELLQQTLGDVRGSMGVQLRKREFSAIGEEAFVPPTDTFQWGAFVVEEIEVEPVTFEIGGRFDHQSSKSKATNLTKSFNNYSFSAGAATHPTENDMIGISISRSERSPTPEELFSNGPHLATNAYELGNLNLKNEQAISGEITFKRDVGLFSGSLNIYHTWYKNFIYEHETGQLIDGLNLLEFRARDAKFYGAEVEVNYTVIDESDYQVVLNASGDYVHATFNNGSVVPRIPAASANIGIEYQAEMFDVGGEARFVGKKTKTATNVLPTDGYVSLDFSVTWRPFGDEKNLDVRFQAQNITNAERRQHTSFLKDMLPMPGRNFRLSLNYDF
ncbi:MAG: TonB-dependent receptor [Alphaproteobacteria bacterium]|nr:TonB-dependent receptor [Alphaproteobacteria bacterium]HPF45453.1 TonB-dependent receptor [Emcibacteraceae bacterium]HRW28729.1 TonB-dependent receptor [Emcibacteraceae bacterium]